MYGYPARLPPISNREDLLITLELSDDDTGDPLNLSGTLGSNQGDFTSNAWTVNAGTASTTSSDAITIPAYPIGNQLSALTINVATALSINAGDPVNIFPTAQVASPVNQMLGYVVSYDSGSGKLVVQIGWTFEFEVRSAGPRDPGSGYTPYYDFGVIDNTGPLIGAALGSGVMVTDMGFLQILIPEATFKKIAAPRTYIVGLTATDSINTRQIFIATQPVQYGGVTT